MAHDQDSLCVRHEDDMTEWAVRACDELGVRWRMQRSGERGWAIDRASPSAWRSWLRETGLRGFIRSVRPAGDPVPVPTGGFTLNKRGQCLVMVDPRHDRVIKMAVAGTVAAAKVVREGEFLSRNQRVSPLLPQPLRFDVSEACSVLATPYYPTPANALVRANKRTKADILMELTPRLIETYRSLHDPVQWPKASAGSQPLPAWYDPHVVATIWAHGDLGIKNIRHDGQQLIPIDWGGECTSIFRDPLRWESAYGDAQGMADIAHCVRGGEAFHGGTPVLRPLWAFYIAWLRELAPGAHTDHVVRCNLHFALVELRRTAEWHQEQGGTINKVQRYAVSILEESGLL